MALAGAAAVVGVQQKSLLIFFVSFMALFLLTGIGNGSTYRMIPSIFRRLHEDHGDGTDASFLDFKRQAAGAVGIISAVGAFGGFAIPFVYMWAKNSHGTIVPALQIYVGVFLFMAALTAVFYLRKGARMHNV
jgi:NNP family nitrate/nitrite transporter-like MFS transporter